MKRCAGIFLTVAMVGCGGGKSGVDLGGGADGGGSDDGGADMTMQMTGDMTMKKGMPIGAPCGATADCGEGKLPVCWTQTLFNKPMYDMTPGGYCSSRCVADADCGTGFCVDFGPPDGKFCLASCMAPSDCRMPGYACFFGGLNFGTTADGCFPNTQLDCDPTAAGGACMAGPMGMKAPGGCVREAYGAGTAGVCNQLCDLGVGTCPADSGGNPQLCIVDDERFDGNGKPSGDKFVGPICTTSPAVPMSAIGGECLDPDGSHYSNDCVDDAECFLTGVAPVGMGFSPAGDNKCYQMCYLAGGMPSKGMAPACPGPGDGGVGTTCKDVFGVAGASSPQLKVGFCM